MLAIAVLLVPAVADAGRLDFGLRPLLLRLQGHVGSPRDGDDRIRKLDDTARRRDHHASGPPSPKVLGRPSAWTGSRGHRNLVATSTGAQADRPALAVIGFFRGGQRILELSSVEASAAEEVAMGGRASEHRASESMDAARTGAIAGRSATRC